MPVRSIKSSALQRLAAVVIRAQTAECSRCYVLSATTLTRSRVLSMSRWLRRSRRNPPSGRQIFVKKLSPRSNDSVTSVPPSLLERNSYHHVFTGRSPMITANSKT